MVKGKKSPQADMEQRRTTGFLLGLILVLSVCYVALEWNSTPSEVGDFDTMDLSELMHESELVPMSNEETAPLPNPQQEESKSEQLRIVDEEVAPDDAADAPADDAADLAREAQQEEEDQKALASMDVDPQNPLNFHIVEDLPQFPGGATAFMKWLTRNLRYPSEAQKQKTQGRVVAVFYVETDGSISNIKVVESLSPECDSEALRVLRLMPRWKPGILHDKPCRTKVSIPIVFKI